MFLWEGRTPPPHVAGRRLRGSGGVGFGHAEKAQIQAMVRRLLPGVELSGPDAADALALAICHAHHAASRGTIARALAAQGRR